MTSWSTEFPTATIRFTDYCSTITFVSFTNYFKTVIDFNSFLLETFTVAFNWISWACGYRGFRWGQWIWFHYNPSTMKIKIQIKIKDSFQFWSIFKSWTKCIWIESFNIKSTYKVKLHWYGLKNDWASLKIAFLWMTFNKQTGTTSLYIVLSKVDQSLLWFWCWELLLWAICNDLIGNALYNNGW